MTGLRGSVRWVFFLMAVILPAAHADDFGDLPSPYKTQIDGGGPRHPVSTNLYLGNLPPDSETDGQPTTGADGDDLAGASDDEDAINPAAIQCLRGLPLDATVHVVNSTGSSAELLVFADWNANGDFTDAGEAASGITITPSSNLIVVSLGDYITVPTNATTTQKIALRMRLSLKAAGSASGPNGPATVGEVEDYLLQPAAEPIDFGDLPDAPYPTKLINGGASHRIIPNLKLGQRIDGESDGVPTLVADGDDSNAFDDEDGFNPGSVVPFPGHPLTFPVYVTTPNDRYEANLYGFVDWNVDGDFLDANEFSFLNVPSALTNALVQLPWNVPTNAVREEPIAVRLRLVSKSTPGNIGPGGYFASGEVEDYFIQITTNTWDFGDLPDQNGGVFPGEAGSASPPDYRTRIADNGPAHMTRPDLFLGEKYPNGDPDLDSEMDGQPAPLADGDDLSAPGIDDENGLTITGFVGNYGVYDVYTNELGVTNLFLGDTNFTAGSAYRDIAFNINIPVHNTSGADAYVNAFVDFEQNGTMQSVADYGDGIRTVPGDGSVTNVVMGISYIAAGSYGTPEAFTKKLAVRVRMSTSSINNPDGPSLTYGEVHDEVISLNFPAYTGTNYTFDFGDLPETTHIPTRMINNGARHAVVPGLSLGASIDREVDGHPSADALGDDEASPPPAAAASKIKPLLSLPGGDEDGLVSDVVLVPGYHAEFPLRVTTTNGSPGARVFGFVDWNNDGDFNDADERRDVHVLAGLNYELINFGWTVPTNAVLGVKLPLRLRIVAEGQNGLPAPLGPDGYAASGEVEDYFIGPVIPPIDFGDLSAPYPTLSTNNGASHDIFPGLFMGSGVDPEGDGAPTGNAMGDDIASTDDENGFYPGLYLPMPGTTFNYVLQVTTPSISSAKVYGFADWNRDGDFNDDDERTEVYVPAGQSNVLAYGSWNVPGSALTDALIPFRFRLAIAGSQTVYTPPLEPYGHADNGEVEDYLVYVPDPFNPRLDYGDLPDERYGYVAGEVGTATPPDYRTRSADYGPSQYFRKDLYLGYQKPNGDPDLDHEPDGQPESFAQGDDSAGMDDETGLTISDFDQQYVVFNGDTNSTFGGNVLFTGETNLLVGSAYRDIAITFTMPVHNNSGADAYVNAFVDIPQHGSMLSIDDFGNGTQTVPGDGSVTSVTLIITYLLSERYGTPEAFTNNLAVRVRMSTERYIQADGPGYAYGEVHDEIITLNFPAYTGRVHVLDFGDLPETANIPTRIINDGARHAVVAGLSIGSRVDTEVDGVPVVHALGDDAADIDDEDGFSPAAVHPVPGSSVAYNVRVTTLNGLGAMLFGFTDWNNDGDFDDLNERESVPAAAGLSNDVVSLNWNVPTNASAGVKLPVRLRLVSMMQTGGYPSVAPNGYAPNGEVEDYFVLIRGNQLDWGDLPDSGAASTNITAPALDPVTYATTNLGDYMTLASDSGASHYLRPDLVIAATGSLLATDAESDGQPTSAGDGDDSAGDDEDGVVFTNFSFRLFDNVFPGSADALVGVTANVSVKNETGSDGFCSGMMYLDRNSIAPGIGGRISVPSRPGFQWLEFNYTYNLNLTQSISNAALKGVFRFRLTTDTNHPSLSMFEHGGSYFGDGEVEDYVIDIPADFGSWWDDIYLDYGDLNDTNYPTKLDSNGARHAFALGQQTIYLGAVAPDGDLDGKSSVDARGDDNAGLDDEDGFTPPAGGVNPGGPASFNVRVTSDAAATLFGFADWNSDGDFADAGETSTVAVAAGLTNSSVNLLWNVPSITATGQSVAVRLRISTATTLGATGVAPNGEVEDYLVTLTTGYDYGDLPDPSYPTLAANNGARHQLVPGFMIGQRIDAELDGQPDVIAAGDDIAGVDDEDGFDPASILPVPGTATVFPVRVTTPVDRYARLFGFVDWNDDSDFDDAGERSDVFVPGGLSNNFVSLAWNVPVDAVTGITVAVRLRLDFFNQGPAALLPLEPYGPADAGEVEDYVVYVPAGNQRDYGDLPDSLPGTGKGVIGTASPSDYRTLISDNGPSHGFRGDLFLGGENFGPLGANKSSPGIKPLLTLPGPDLDPEIDGQPTPLATGDDANGIDDENGLTITSFRADYGLTNGMPYRDVALSFSMPVANGTGSEGYLAPFIDLLESGSFIDMRSYGVADSVAGDGTQTNVNFSFAYVVGGELANPSAFTRKLAVRVRLSTQNGLSDQGPARDGEVHDEVITLDFPAYTGTVHVLDFGDLPDEPYRTRMVRDGARHTVIPGLAIGEIVDLEADGVPDALAKGDDLAASDDEDGFDPSSLTLIAGTVVDFPVRVTTLNGDSAVLHGFVDWNNDGDFDDSGERRSLIVGAGLSNSPVLMNWSIPVDAVTSTGVAVRLRLVGKGTVGLVTALDPHGYAPSGEVEDYFVQVQPGYDFGDLPDALPGIFPGVVSNSSTITQADYKTRLADDGPRHVIRSDLSFFESGLTPVDSESDGQPSAEADGDGSDETGMLSVIVHQSVSNITSASIDIYLTMLANLPVDNRTGTNAYMYGFLDANNDGDFDDAGETLQLTVPSTATPTNYSFEFRLFIKVERPTTSFSANLPARFRLSTQSGLGPNGPASDGEVEDYIIKFMVIMDEWWQEDRLRTLVDLQTPAKLTVPKGFPAGTQPYKWQIGQGNYFNLTGASPIMQPNQLGTLPSGINPYFITAQRSDTAVDLFIGQLFVRDLPVFRSWMQQASLTGDQASPNADPDGDGRSNIDEYAQGTNPSNRDEPVKPTPSITTTGQVTILTWPYLRRANGSTTGSTYMTSELMYQFDGTQNVTNWNQAVAPAPIPGSTPVPTTNYEWGAVSLSSTNPANRGFILRTILVR